MSTFHEVIQDHLDLTQNFIENLPISYMILPLALASQAMQSKNLLFVEGGKKLDVQDIRFLKLFVGDDLVIEDVVTMLIKVGFKRVRRIWGQNEVAVLGDTLYIWPVGMEHPLRVSLFDQEIESISSVYVDSLTVIKEFEALYIPLISTEYNLKAMRLVNNSEAWCVLTVKQFSNERSEFSFCGIKVTPLSNVLHSFNFSNETLVEFIRLYQNRGFKVITNVKKEDLTNNSLTDYIDEYVDDSSIIRGFVLPDQKIIFLTRLELLGDVMLKDEGTSENSFASLFNSFVVGDYVVHEDHGIGIFSGLEYRNGKEYLKLTYANKDELLVPETTIEKVSKYVGSKRVKVHSLDNSLWKRQKQRTQLNILLYAKEILELEAQHRLEKSFKLLNSASLQQQFARFVNGWEFLDTIDQQIITKQLLEDFQADQPMHRLIVGDVGFGKTELALRSIFASIISGFQAVLMAPTTVLALQHYSVATKRFKNNHIRIAVLSRFTPLSERKRIVRKFNKGLIDLLIGTTALLSSDIVGKRVAMIVVDEEQKFGVKQKNLLFSKFKNAHILTMSATPIPRSLALALNSLHSLSVLASAPPGRKPIVNKFLKETRNKDFKKRCQIIRVEVERGEQVLYVHNNISELLDIVKRLKEVCSPDVTIELLHAQLPTHEIKKRMESFINGEIHVLVTTTIVANGLDLKNINTLIVDDIYRYGLSQLYQLRGRIGRGEKQAFAYFFFDQLPGKTELRLNALKASFELGAGFNIATKDLEIRGMGNLLGIEQSGNISRVGASLYFKMLNEIIDYLKKKND